ncbi:S8 family serine peptidase [Kangiella sp. TOML190]|uniref:S8 family peptidase n=1 Tax=Kangiella sp. TOML190 TaxID=2931351 RepID=UPI002042601B|nr:S8 family serine peptidase [Kangiella sp. TOML190]
MKTKFNRKLLVTLCSTALLGTTQIALAEQTYDVIVKLKNPNAPFAISAQSAQRNATPASRAQFFRSQAQVRKSAVQSYAQKMRIKPNHVYDTAYFGFSAKVTKAQRDALQSDPNVEAVYEDVMYQLLHPANNKQSKTYKKKRKLIDWPQVVPQAPMDSGSYASSYKGSGQHVYVLDSGVDTHQNDIKDNMGLSYAPVFCFKPSDSRLCPLPFSDDNGHGTHVAGTVAAADNAINSLGVAPEATIHAVKVCNYTGSCPGSAILAGLNWSVFDMLGRGEAAVANLSLGGGDGSDAGTCDETGYTGDHFVAETYCNAAHQGMVIVVAAGNSSADAAGFSPAQFDSTIAVSSYTSYDADFDEVVFSGFSNYGEGPNSWSSVNSGVITIGAPGNSITSLNRTHANTLLSGTSMASPAVAGAAALVMEKYTQSLDFSALQNVRQMLVDNAIYPSFVTDDDEDFDYPHAEGILNVRFLEDDEE